MLQDSTTHTDRLIAYATTHQFQFKFITSRAPHFGGLWESSVKMAKGLLLKAIGNEMLREDELQTVLVEVLAVLNSSPLVADSNNPNDGEVITPALFLIESTLGTLPPASAQQIQEGTLTHLKRWQLVSAIKQLSGRAITSQGCNNGPSGRRKRGTFELET